MAANYTFDFAVGQQNKIDLFYNNFSSSGRVVSEL